MKDPCAVELLKLLKIKRKKSNSLLQLPRVHFWKMGKLEEESKLEEETVIAKTLGYQVFSAIFLLYKNLV